jgi:hypothetical protein
MDLPPIGCAALLSPCCAIVERVCSHCKTTGRCRRELDAGTAAMRCREYCPNAATFDDLIGYYRDQ